MPGTQVSTSPVGLGAGRSAAEIYAKAGFLGVGLGFGYGVNENLTLRADFTTMGNYSIDRDIGGTPYNATLSNNTATVYADWFPSSSSGFRLTGGLGYRDMKATGTGRAPDTLGVPPGLIGPDDTLNATVKWPKFAPYLGLGFGHNVGQQAEPGWGFIADVGVYLGTPSVGVNMSDSAQAKFNAYAPGGAQAEVDRQVASIQEQVDKLKVTPSLYVGVSYHF